MKNIIKGGIETIIATIILAGIVIALIIVAILPTADETSKMGNAGKEKIGDLTTAIGS